MAEKPLVDRIFQHDDSKVIVRGVTVDGYRHGNFFYRPNRLEQDDTVYYCFTEAILLAPC
jgi:hypothetical protein